MEKLKAQTEAALLKNKEIEQINEQIKKELAESSGDAPDFSEISRNKFMQGKSTMKS